MINPQDLQDAIVKKLRDITELVSFVGDAGEIQAYDDESEVSGDPETAEISMSNRSVLVVWSGADLPRTGETRGWKHTFRISLKAESIVAYYQLAQLIFDGHPAGEFDTFLNCNISDLTDGIQDAVIEPARGADKLGRLLIQFSLYER